MGSKDHMPPHFRQPLPGPDMMHPDPFGSRIHSLAGPFFDMLPPPEIMEQKLNVQHMEMQRLVTENQRLAATHVTLRQELAAAQQELQRLQIHINAIKADKEQQMRVLLDRLAKMDADLQSSEPVKVELQQAHAEAQNLMADRKELISKVQQLTQDLQRSLVDVQQIPTLMSELEGLRREYQDCRVTYEYEKKLYNDHLESLQVMEKNYVSMARELEKLRAELANTSNLERRSGGQFSGNAGYKENDASVHQPVGQNPYEDGYGVPQGRVPASGVAAPPYGGGPPAADRFGYDASRGAATYDASRGATYDASRGATYDASGAFGYDASSRGATAYDASRGANYDASRGAGASRGGSYEAPRAHGYEGQRGAVAGVVYDSSRGAAGVAQAPGGAYGQMQTPTRAGVAQAPGGVYGQMQTPTRAGEAVAPPRGGNVARR